MPIDPDVQREINRLTAQIGVLDGSVRRLATRLDAAEKNSPSAVLGEIRDLLRPLAAIAQSILDVKAGALGVRN
jgi:hypothetical protein